MLPFKGGGEENMIHGTYSDLAHGQQDHTTMGETSKTSHHHNHGPLKGVRNPVIEAFASGMNISQG